MKNDLYFEYLWHLDQIIYDMRENIKILKKHEKQILTDNIDWEDWDVNSIANYIYNIAENLHYLPDCL